MSVSVQVRSAESPLLHPRRFVKEALQDLFRSRETAIRLFRQNIAQRYRYSSLGLLWAFAPSVVTALVLTLGNRSGSVPAVHTGAHAVAQLSVPPAFYAVFGLVLGQTFLDTFGTQRSLFMTHRYLLSRHRVPIEGLVLAGIADNLFGLTIRMGILVVLFLVYGVSPVRGVPIGLLGLGSIFLIGSGFGLLLAPINALKRDLDNVMQFFPWVLFALTPVFVEPKPGVGLYQIYRFNPLAWTFDATRAFTYGHHAGHGLAMLLSLLFAATLLPLTWLFCRIARPYVVERLIM